MVIPKMATEDYQKALELGKTRGDKRQVAEAYLGLGDAHKFSDNVSSIHYYERASEIARDRRDKEQEIKALLGLGSVYKLLNNFQKAIDYYQDALKIANEK